MIWLKSLVLTLFGAQFYEAVFFGADRPVKPLGRGVFDHIADTTASTGRRPW